VWADLDNYFPIVRSGGMIILADYVIGNWWHGGAGDGRASGAHALQGPFRMDNRIAIEKLA
jgi:hypothetical protein